MALVVESKLLFEEPPQNSLFAHLLQGKSHCVCELCMLEKIIGVKPLLNNCFSKWIIVKDNKNQHLLTFFSLLITKDVFEEMKLDFLSLAIHMNILMDVLGICQIS
jgi:hypothetical protein